MRLSSALTPSDGVSLRPGNKLRVHANAPQNAAAEERADATQEEVQVLQRELEHVQGEASATAKEADPLEQARTPTLPLSSCHLIFRHSRNSSQNAFRGSQTKRTVTSKLLLVCRVLLRLMRTAGDLHLKEHMCK